LKHTSVQERKKGYRKKGEGSGLRWVFGLGGGIPAFLRGVKWLLNSAQKPVRAELSKGQNGKIPWKLRLSEKACTAEKRKGYPYVAFVPPLLGKKKSMKEASAFLTILYRRSSPVENGNLKSETTANFLRRRDRMLRSCSQDERKT